MSHEISLLSCDMLYQYTKYPVDKKTQQLKLINQTASEMT